jgi:iron only hydrogenase large subunit-like protein
LATDTQEGKVPPPMVNDLSQVKSEMIEVSAGVGGFNNGGRMINQKEVRNKIQSAFDESESLFSSKNSK